MSRAVVFDTSFYQTVIDWAQVKQYTDCVVTQITQDNWKDWTAKDKWLHMLTLEKPIGGYHLYRPNPSFGGAAQAKLFIDTFKAIDPALGTMPPMFDFELRTNRDKTVTYSNNQLCQDAHAFLDTVEQLTGKKCIIYTGLWFIDKSMTTMFQWMKAYHAWLADYPWEREADFVQNYIYYQSLALGTCSPFSMQGYVWSEWLLWQWTGHGRIPGVGGDCDMNVWNGDKAQMLLDLNITPPTPVPVPTPPTPTLEERVTRLEEQVKAHGWIL